jgi:hypothetical protein
MNELADLTKKGGETERSPTQSVIQPDYSGDAVGWQVYQNEADLTSKEVGDAGFRSVADLKLCQL